MPRRGSSASNSEITKIIGFSEEAWFGPAYGEQTSRKSFSVGQESGSGTLIAPVPNFPETFATGLLEQADTMADVLKFMNIGPDFCLPVLVMNCGFAAGSAAGVESADHWAGGRLVSARQLDEDTTYFLDVFVGVNY